MKETTVPTTMGGRPIPATRDESRTFVPPVDIFDYEDGLVVVADLPGIEKEKVDVRVEKGVLTIHGMNGHAAPRDYVYREFEPVSFFRQFQLPEEVDQTKIEAQMKHGVLTIRLPKAEESRPKKIEVTTVS